MAGIHVSETASIFTDVTTIFQDNQDERYVNLRADRKQISIQVTNFVRERKLLMTMTQEDIDEDFEITARFGDSDQARYYLALNAAAWVHGAHATLDPCNQYDNAMLGKMADYVMRIQLIAGSEAFFDPDCEDNRKAVFPSRDDIVLRRSDEDIVKRKREVDSDESFLPPKALIVDGHGSSMMSYDTSTENVAERIIIPGGEPARRMRRSVSRQREARASTSSQAALTTHLQPAAVTIRPTPVPALSPIPTLTQACPHLPTKQEEAVAEMATKNVIDGQNEVRLRVIQDQSIAFKGKILAETRLQEDRERVALDLAEQQHQNDKANLAEARQMRKVASIQKVVDTQQSSGQVSLAHHDQMQQILADLNSNGRNDFAFLPPKEDDIQETLIDLTGYTQVTKKKSPNKTQPKTLSSTTKN